MTSQPRESLVPGYTQVESFGDDDEYEEEEVSYVTLDLGGVEPTLVPSASSYHLIGLDTPTPFLQLQGTVLKGRHNTLLGTELMFTEDKDLHEWNKRSVHHVANSEQRILFKEVTLERKSPEIDRMAATGEGAGKEGTEPDAQKIDRMTGRIAPSTRAPRAKGSGKKKGKASASEPTQEDFAAHDDRMDVATE
ncbi:hypothetical protein BKA70DRAFT_1193898 [Coprinopsis sp. MPI-PUGE-AT-0042]|nr:hypothetical protein BKA70DRAFT_1193898 [Coprinopsis sp. MPI-PUGE-AT-0042]